MSPLRIGSIVCFGVAALMFVLGTIGTYDTGLFYTWMVVGALGLAGGLLLAKMDDSARRRRLDEDRQRRLGQA